MHEDCTFEIVDTRQDKVKEANFFRLVCAVVNFVKFVIVLMTYYDITEREKDRFDMGMC